MQWLSQREHSRAELQRKLLQVMQSPSRFEYTDAAQWEAGSLQVVTQLLNELEASGYLNEARFIESRVHNRARKWGLHRIQQEMRQHDVCLPTDAIDALKQTELERAQLIWQRKFSTPPTNPIEKAKQIRFLIGRGFSSETIKTLFKAINL